MSEEPICKSVMIHEDVINKVQKAMPERSEFDELASLFKCFSDRTRASILWALLQHEMCVCDLGVLLDMTMPAISHHLKILRLSNLVTYRKEGKVVYYRLADDHVKAILECGFEHTQE